MAAFLGLVTVGANVSQGTRDKAFGAQGGSLTIAQLVDAIMLASGDQESFIIQFSTGTVHRLLAAGLAKVEALEEDLSEPIEAFSVLAEDEELRSPKWVIQNRTRTYEGEGGTAGISDVIDPIVPGTSLPTLLGRLESNGVADVVFVSQKPTAMAAVAGGVGVVAVFPAADYDKLFATDSVVADPEVHSTECETFTVARDDSEAVTLRDQVFE